METQLWLLPVPAGCVRGGLNKGTMVPAGTLIPEGAVLPAVILKPDISVPPHVSLVLSQLLFLLWSLGQVFVSLCSGPLRG